MTWSVCLIIGLAWIFGVLLGAAAGLRVGLDLTRATFKVACGLEGDAQKLRAELARERFRRMELERLLP